MYIAEGAPGPFVQINGRRYLYFVGTGYLGLQNHPEVLHAACEAIQRYGIHSATTRAGFGNTPLTLDAERRAAQWFHLEDAFHFASGYAANSILLQSLASEFDALFIDELSHYSVFDAARRTRHPIVCFRHACPGDLAQKLRDNLRTGQRPLVLTDGVFSVRGTIAPIAEYDGILEEYAGAGLMVDDAHGVAVLGDQGRGALEYAGRFDGRVNDVADDSANGPGRGCRKLLTATASKAIGGYGGLIPGSRPFIDRLKKTSHWYDGASAPPAAVSAATAKAIEVMLANPHLRRQLQQNVAALKTGLQALGLAVDETPVPIACLVLGKAANMARIQKALMERGIAIACMTAYAGLGPEGGLRIAVFANHTQPMIEQLLDELRRVLD